MPANRLLQWTVGDVQIHRIVEVANHADPIGILLKDATERIFDPFSSWLRPHFISDADQMLIQWQAFAIRTPRLNLMIDTCIGNDRKRFFQVFNDMHTPFLEDLASCGFVPHDINLVCCTHLHYDHVGWNTHLENGKWTPTFPNAVYLIDNTEYAEMRELQVLRNVELVGVRGAAAVRHEEGHVPHPGALQGAFPVRKLVQGTRRDPQPLRAGCGRAFQGLRTAAAP